jgi:hypothetical protein
MIRWLLLGLGYLLLGAAITVAVAWTLSRRAPEKAGATLTQMARQRSFSEGRGWLTLSSWQTLGATSWRSEVVPDGTGQMFGEPFSSLETVPPRDVRPMLFPWIHGRERWPEPHCESWSGVATYGWPFRSLASVHRGEWGGGNADDEWRSGVLRIPSLASSANGWVPGLPIRILPRGFVLDTFVATGILWIAPRSIREARRRFRASRGLCPQCAYDLRGSPTGDCPECGVNSRAALSR